MMEPVAPEVVLEAFLKLDLRVGTITKAEKIEKSEKLLKLEVSFGELGVRTIVAGIGKSFDPEVLPGRQVIALHNLVARKVFAGIESHGMLLSAKLPDGSLILASCPGAPDGARLG